MITDQTHEKLKQIKQSFRLLMNGVASQSMREKGVSYKINWGIPVPELQKMAVEYGKDYDLAIELWNVGRSCGRMDGAFTHAGNGRAIGL